MENDGLQSILMGFATDPFLLGLGIIVATFILEDAATVSAALFAADGLLSTGWALTALFIGIVLGDLGLYGLGMLAKRFRWAEKLLALDKVHKARDWMDRRVVITVISARFLPGMRTPTYAACGFFGLSFTKFALSAIIATAIWTAALFTLLLTYGQSILDSFGPWRWAAIPVIILLVMILPRLISLARPKAV